jgi:hypothetical protein
LVGHNSAQFTPDILGSVQSLGHNLITSTDGEQFWLPSDRIADPLIGPLASHFGPTPTHALLPGSPALDAGRDAQGVLSELGFFPGRTPPITTDQRGGPRVVDLPAVPNATGGNGSDIGAIEMGSIPPRLTGISVNPVTISFTSDPGLPYRLESRNSLSPGPWSAVPGSESPGNGGVISSFDTRPGTPTRFYRVAAP